METLNMKRVFLNILTLLALTALNAQAATYYVATTGNDSNPGTQAQPFRTIARGIAATADGDTVSVADGTYNEHDLDFGTKNLTLRSQSGNSSACFLDCQEQGPGIKITGGQTAATVTGITIRNGRTSIDGTGAAISISYSSATISNCIFSACKAVPPPNTPSVLGDAVFITHSPGVAIVGSYFINTGGHPFGLGAVFVGDSDAITISDCFFNGNLSGAVRTQSCNSATITRCRFTNNTSISGAGAISWLFHGIVSVDRCIFTGNLGNSSSRDQGGAIFFNEGELTVTNSLFVGNTTTINPDSTHAGSIMLYSHQNRPLSAKIANCTILADTNLDMDGNVVMDCPQFSDGRPNLIVTNCILRGGFRYGDFAVFGGRIQVTYSNLQDVDFEPGVGNIGTDPKFVNPAGGDYHLQSSSPCFNTGTASAPGLPVTDMDGLPRVMGSAPDMGAYELWTASIGAWFVDKTDGNDFSGTGSPTAPFRTVNMALSRVTAPSDFTTIHVKAGNYGSDRSTITKKVRFVNWGNTGQARIGKQ
jgi:hypothetical protein